MREVVDEARVVVGALGDVFLVGPLDEPIELAGRLVLDNAHELRDADRRAGPRDNRDFFFVLRWPGGDASSVAGTMLQLGERKLRVRGIREPPQRPGSIADAISLRRRRRSRGWRQIQCDRSIRQRRAAFAAVRMRSPLRYPQGDTDDHLKPYVR